MTRWPLLAFGTFLAIAVALTWPMAVNPGGTVMPDAGDPLLNTWILWWNATTLPLTTTWWNAPVFFPAEGAITFSEHLLGLWPLASPIVWLTGSPLAAYNVTLLLTFALSATAAFLLGYELTGRWDAALVCGVAFGFAPYRIAQLPHLQVLASFWMPVALLGLHRYLRDGKTTSVVLFASAWLMQALSNMYFMLFFPLLVLLWCLWFVRPQQWRKAAVIAIAAGLAALPLIPILARYREVHAKYNLTRDLSSMEALSLDATAWLDRQADLAMWGQFSGAHRPEGEMFTGLVVLVLIAAGLLWAALRHRRNGTTSARGSLWFYALAALVMFLLALGPAPTFFGAHLPFPGPYRLLMWIPGFDGLRVPGRFAMVTALCLSAAAGLAFAALSSAWTRWARWIVAALAATAIVAEAWPSRIHQEPPPASMDVRHEDGPGAVIVLPLLRHWNEIAVMYSGMSHGRPIVNGYSGHEPAWYPRLRQRLESFDPSVLDALADAGVTQVAVVARHDRGGDWRAFVATRATHTRTSEDGTLWIYDFPTAETRGTPLPIQSIDASDHPGLIPAMTDGNPETFWHSRQPQTGGESVRMDLGAPRRVTTVEASLGRFIDAYPRELAIEVSEDGTAWRESWRGPTGNLVTLPVFEEPRDVRIRLPLGGVTARFLRLTQIGRADQSSWTIAELVVRGDPTASGPAR